jgi:hypothetical protein
MKYPSISNKLISLSLGKFSLMLVANEISIHNIFAAFLMGQHLESDLLSYATVSSGRWLPVFQRNLLSLSSA